MQAENGVNRELLRLARVTILVDLMRGCGNLRPVILR